MNRPVAPNHKTALDSLIDLAGLSPRTGRATSKNNGERVYYMKFLQV